MDSINTRIAEELSALPSGRVQPQQVAAAVALLDEGSTVPFIARYRKEVTGSLDDTQLRMLEERLRYLRELEERRGAILASIEEQGKLTPELARDIKLADTKTRLEDLYLPYKQKRRTKGQIALEAGLGALADALFDDPTLVPESEAARFVDAEKGFADVKAVLEGAKYILMERFAEDATLLDKLRVFMKNEATLTARVVPGKELEGAKFSDYFEHDEPLKSAPSHRALAIFRGRNEGVLSASLKVGEEAPGTLHPSEVMIAERFGLSNQGRAADKWLAEVVRWTWKVKLYTHLETDLFGELRDGAEDEAISVFARNLHDLLLAAPAGPRATLGLDPGLRTGVKVAVVDATGKLLDNNKSPSRKVGDIDNRGSHFYLAMYWAQALAAQDEDAELKAHFAPLAKALTEQEATIVAELNAVQGKPAEIGGYYRSNPELTSKVMRPSATFNAAIDSLA